MDVGTHILFSPGQQKKLKPSTELKYAQIFDIYLWIVQFKISLVAKNVRRIST